MTTYIVYLIPIIIFGWTFISQSLEKNNLDYSARIFSFLVVISHGLAWWKPTTQMVFIVALLQSLIFLLAFTLNEKTGKVIFLIYFGISAFLAWRMLLSA